MDVRTAQPGYVPKSECRGPRFAELDAQIQAEAKARQDLPMVKPKRRRRSTPPLPAAIRKEITRLARELNRRYRQLLKADPKLKDRAARLLRSLLLPKPRRRGRPGIPSVTRAIALLKRYRREHSGERAEMIWKRIYPEVIPGYSTMNEVER